VSPAASHSRDDVARALDTGLGELGVVICGLGSGSRAWRELGSARPAYYCSDPMGVSLSMAAGFALARPDRPVALMVGDGDLLMGLGALVTVAGATPENLSVVVLANLRYETGGGRPLPGSSRLDIASAAAAAGWGSVSVAGADLAGDMAAALEAPGPSLVVVGVRSQAAPYGGPGRWSGVEERVQFELGLAAGDDAAQQPTTGGDG
jgi:thiamine pyrophosphate-dependent acetolactate synthase large subunit-like protein